MLLYDAKLGPIPSKEQPEETYPIGKITVKRKGFSERFSLHAEPGEPFKPKRVWARNLDEF